MWLLVVPSHQRKLAGRKFSLIQDPRPRKSSNFTAPCTVSIRQSKCLWILVQMTRTECAKSRGVLGSNANVGKSDRYFQFDWPSNITKWTALVACVQWMVSTDSAEKTTSLKLKVCRLMTFISAFYVRHSIASMKNVYLPSPHSNSGDLLAHATRSNTSEADSNICLQLSVYEKM